ncbi:hypothetical protein [Arthrobacter sp. CP30]
MTDLELHQPQEIAQFGDSQNGTDLAAWVADLGDAFTLADKICRTPFAPRDFQGKPEAAAVAILHGKSLGLDPLASMSSIFVISGRPGLYSKAMHAIVLAAGHQVWVESESAQEVVVKGKRRGSDAVSTARWTPERAQQAGYASNAKYKTEPIAMLRARAIGDVCRVVAPDVLAGLAYNEADVAVMEDLGEHPKPSQQSATSRLAEAAASTPPPTAPEAAGPAEAESTETLCSRKQQTDLGNALKALGYTTKDDMLGVVTGWVGREISGSKDLTVSEAKQLTDELITAATEKNQAAEDVVDADGVLSDPVVDEAADAAWLAGN